MNSKKEYIIINGKSYRAENRGFDEFLSFKSNNEVFKIVSVSGPQRQSIDLIKAISDMEVEGIEVKVTSPEKKEQTLAITKENNMAIFEILLYVWYLKFGKYQRILFNDKEISSENVNNRIFIKDNVYFCFHKILGYGNEYQTVCDILNQQYPKVGGVSLNHKKGRAQFSTLSQRDYLYKYLGAFLLDSIHIAPSFIFDKDEFFEHSLESLLEISKHANYNTNLYFTNRTQPSLKNL